MAETPPNDDRIERARRLFERATPKLRAAGEAIERSDELREALDTITDREVDPCRIRTQTGRDDRGRGAG